LSCSVSAADGLYLPGAAFCARAVRRDEGGGAAQAQRHPLPQQEVLPASAKVRPLKPLKEQEREMTFCLVPSHLRR